MESPIYILGHKNPDADAICSAIAYESFKRAIGQTHYIAARCGNSNARIDAILKKFGLKLPPFIGDVTPRIESIMHRGVRSVTKDNTCGEALELIDKYDVRALPVVSESGNVEGIISIFQLGEFFIPKLSGPKEMRRVNTSIDSISRSVNATVLNKVDSERIEDLYIRVGAMDIGSFAEHNRYQEIPATRSIVVVGDRLDIQECCLEMGVRLLVITGGLDVEDSIIEGAQRRNISLIVSPYDSASTSWMIRTATHVSSIVLDKYSVFFAEDKISTVKQRIATSNEPLYMVLNEDKKLTGVFSKSDILRPSKTRIALVDHNELGQAVTGASEVNITEIVDHHRLGNTPTEGPILFINRPVGSTCSIIADFYRSRNLTPEPEIAGIMMSGIISDTLHLNSPTTTSLEGQLLDWLAPIAGISSSDLADLIFSSGSVILSQKPYDVINSDCKIYDEGSIRYSVSQIEELGFNNFWEHAEKLDEALEGFCEAEGLLFSFLLVTDINTQNSLLVVAGNKDIRDEINFPQVNYENIYELNGIVSRKKQLIPYITTLLKSMGVLA
ncbi:MAG: putative manganese-dependent inorganic diphosphatase [Verrucomicrobiota bacterium]